MWFALVLLGVDATLGIACVIWENLHSFREVKCHRGYSKTLSMEIQKFKTSFLLAEYVAVVITETSQPDDAIPKDNQISIPFYEVCFLQSLGT